MAAYRESYSSASNGRPEPLAGHPPVAPGGAKGMATAGLAARPEGHGPPAVDIVAELKQRGCTFYGTENCPWCTKQKEVLGDRAGEIFVDCAMNPGECQGVSGVPFWRCENGASLSGFQMPDALLQKLV